MRRAALSGSRGTRSVYARAALAAAAVPPSWSAAPAFVITEGDPSIQNLPVSVANGADITLTWIAPGSQPAWITLNSGPTPRITFSGAQADADDKAGVVIRATANGLNADSPAGSITVQSSSISFTANIGLDPFNAGEGSQGLGWPKGGIAADGMMINWCTDGYAQDDNSVRGFNMWPSARVDATGTTRASSLGGTGWRRFGDDAGSTIGSYVSAHDNMPHFNLVSTNNWVTPSRGVFAVNQGAWISGNIMGPAGTTYMESTVRLITAQDISEDRWGNNAPYNPMSQWVEAEEVNFVAGGAPSQTPLNAMWLIERTLPSDGYSQPWKMTRKTVPAAVTTLSVTVGCQQNRNLTCAVGPYVYFGVEQQKFWRMDMRDRTMQTVVQLADWPAAAGTYYALMTYDERRRKIVIMGQGAYSYDIATNVWSNITPAGWLNAEFVVGDYSRDLDAHYFRATPVNYGEFTPRSWHKLYLGNPSNNPRWRSQTIGLTPFKGLLDNGYGQFKHVCLAWCPTRSRVYQMGGDFGYGAASFSQPEPGQSVATNQPSGARSYTVTDSLRVDMYSFDPSASGTVNWRLEHPHYQLNQSGAPEPKPGFTDQIQNVWDINRAKFWCFQHDIRDDQSGIPRYLADGVTLDPWANGDTFINGYGKIEGRGTYAWTPSAGGGTGTWTKVTDNYLWGDINYSNPAQVGNALRIYGGDSSHLYCGKWAHYKPGSVDKFISIFGDIGGSPNKLFLTTFNPSTNAYEWRVLSTPGSLTRLLTRLAPIAVVDNFAYVTGIGTASGARKSFVVRVDIDAALAVAAGGTVSSSAVTLLDAPFTFAPNGEWESNADASTNWWVNVGLCAIDRKIVLIGSYGATLVKGGITRIATYVPDTGRWVMGDPFPGAQYNAKAWCALPETGEILLMPTSSAEDESTAYSSAYTYWYYRVR